MNRRTGGVAAGRLAASDVLATAYIAEANKLRSRVQDLEHVLQGVELLMRVNAPMNDGSQMHKTVLKVLNSTEKKQ